MRFDTRKLRGVLRAIAKQARTEDSPKLQEINTIAGFDVSYFDDKAVCAATVLNAKTMSVVEKKYLLSKPEMPYVPGLLSFREGPLILQAYYDLEQDPDVLMIDGHGIAHPLRAGLATYVGVELAKPTIGVAKKLLVGEVKDDKIIVNNEVRGVLVRTKKHAKPLFVSPGHLISVEKAAEIVKACVVPPHKLPEPLHQAHRFADKISQRHASEKAETNQ